MIHPARTMTLSAQAIIVVPALLLLVLSGCASSGSLDQPRVDSPGDEPIRQSDNHTRLVMSMSGWLDTPYLYGGNLKDGIDCSAYVQALMSKAFEVDLPRTTRQQMNVGEEVDRNRLLPGDLVFFKTGRNQYHVGIFLEEGEFTHASASSGVTVSHLNDFYWRDKFLMGRRVMETPSDAQFASSRVAEAAPRRTPSKEPSRTVRQRDSDTKKSGTWTSDGEVSETEKPGRTGW